ncbi:DUF3179 domain-containing protein [Candidatus Uhrbacteria bacterium]|nr:DUF3179 domain-containing protein [Candidatus Uhrbacteria bacterium]
MTQHRSAFILLVAAVLVSGVFYFEYRTHRTPILVSQESAPQILESGVIQDGIPAITEPVIESIAAADVYLENDGLGIAVEDHGYARFYPFQILVWHEVVNDTFRGEEILVTYCPLTYSSAVYERTVADEVVVFGVSGKVMDSNTLLFDATSGSLWSQLKGEAIEGAFIGAKLVRLPSTILSWSAFKTDYPYGDVLSRETGADRDYTQDPYDREGYYDSAAIWFPLSHEDARLPAKTIVYGYEQDGVAMAYPVDFVQAPDDDRILRSAYWFAWASAYPETLIYQQ